VRNEEERVCSAPNTLISGKIIKEMPGSVANGTPCTIYKIKMFHLILCAFVGYNKKFKKILLGQFWAH
jgi:hypothetical protein